MRLTPTGFVLCGWMLLATAVYAQCPKERGAVKMLKDPAGSEVSAHVPLKITVHELVAAEAPERSEVMKAESSRFPIEQSVYEVQVLVVGFKKEADLDFHIVIADRENPKITMIAEIPAGSCADGPWAKLFDDLQRQFAAQVGKPSAKFKKPRKPVAATFRGIGFFDVLHGQTGVAPNGIELHPLLSFEVAI